MQTSYRPLLSLRVLHAHFGGSACPDLSVVPMAETAALMRDRRMRLRPVAGGAVLYIDSRNLMAEALPKAPLRFVLAVSDPRFFQYTALGDLQPAAGQVAAFDNLRTFKGQITDDGRLLAPAGEIAALDEQASPAVAEAIRQGWLSGQVFALVTVHLGQAPDPAVPTGMKAIAAGKPQEPRFVISLAARQAHWRYVVAGVDTSARIEASVVQGNKAIAFAAPAAARIAGRDALVFQSTAALPVLADPRGVYTAKLITGDGDERLLPLPAVAALKANQDGDGMVAEMIVLAERVG